MARPEVTGPKIDKLAFGIQEFCDLHGISRAHYYTLRKLGLGPREMSVHGRKVISTEAARDWRREREATSEDEAESLTTSGQPIGEVPPAIIGQDIGGRSMTSDAAPQAKAIRRRTSNDAERSGFAERP